MTKEQKDKIEETLLELKYVCLNEDQYANGVEHLHAVYKASNAVYDAIGDMEEYKYDV